MIMFQIFLIVATARLALSWSVQANNARGFDGRARGLLCPNTPYSRGCWTGVFDINTDVDNSYPNTGRTVEYNFEISNATLAPDGFSTEMLVINGQYPGPTVEANWGDTISVTIKNSLTNNGTGIHWHGIRQLDTNTMDGTAGVTECPIAPGESRTYTWKATQYGTSWYHSHYSVQYAAGVSGAIVIHGPATANYDIDLGPLTLTDWFHEPFFTVAAAAEHASAPPVADTILINGSMTSSSGGQFTEVALQPGKKHLLRIINTGINGYMHVGLDNHKLTVIAADFVPIEPYTTDSIVIAVGQRYDVIIDANQEKGAYWFRVATGAPGCTGQTCCDGPVANQDTKAIFYYSGCDGQTPTSTGTPLPTGCYDETVTPYRRTKVPSGSLNPELDLSFSPASNATTLFWTINSHALQVDWEHPLLQYVEQGNTSYPANLNVETVNRGSGWTYWVIQQDPAALAKLPHPIHLHGHDFYVLAQGTGAYQAASLNYASAVRRDTATLPANGYLVLAFKTDNPGAWLMHCHVPFHINGGLGVQFLERADDIKHVMDLSVLDGECSSWSKYWSSSSQDEGGSGL